MFAKLSRNTDTGLEFFLAKYVQGLKDVQDLAQGPVLA
jgi:hypothetical protein